MPIHGLSNIQPDPIPQHRAVVVDDIFWIKEQRGASDMHLFRLWDIYDDFPGNEVWVDAPCRDHKPPKICFSDRGR
jgi:hypothetical protein